MKKVLIIDDEKNIREIYEEELKEEGYKTLSAVSIKDALRKIEEFSPDLIILDIKMPEENGLFGLKKIKNLYKNIPVIICSAYPEYRQNFLTWSADDYVVKSSDLTELKEKIKKILNE